MVLSPTLNSTVLRLALLIVWVIRFCRSEAESTADLLNAIQALYRDGRGTKRNDAKAMAWYRKAAEQGYAPVRV